MVVLRRATVDDKKDFDKLMTRPWCEIRDPWHKGESVLKRRNAALSTKIAWSLHATNYYRFSAFVSIPAPPHTMHLPVRQKSEHKTCSSAKNANGDIWIARDDSLQGAYGRQHPSRTSTLEWDLWSKVEPGWKIFDDCNSWVQYFEYHLWR